MARRERPKHLSPERRVLVEELNRARAAFEDAERRHNANPSAESKRELDKSRRQLESAERRMVALNGP